MDGGRKGGGEELKITSPKSVGWPGRLGTHIRDDDVPNTLGLPASKVPY